MVESPRSNRLCRRDKMRLLLYLSNIIGAPYVQQTLFMRLVRPSPVRQPAWTALYAPANLRTTRRTSCCLARLRPLLSAAGIAKDARCPRGSGGIGRRVSLRSWWPKGRRGSSPFFRNLHSQQPTLVSSQTLEDCDGSPKRHPSRWRRTPPESDLTANMDTLASESCFFNYDLGCSYRLSAAVVAPGRGSARPDPLAWVPVPSLVASGTVPDASCRPSAIAAFIGDLSNIEQTDGRVPVRF